MRFLCAALCAVSLPLAADWTPLFDGKTLTGWRAAENPASFSVNDGAIVANGPRAHLFYTGADFRNFELRAEIKLKAGSNSGIFFHSAWQEKGWPEQGFEAQICNDYVDPSGYRENKKTGSLYGVRNVYKKVAPDDQWFEMRVRVEGKRVRIHVDNTLVVDFVEPDPPELGGTRARKLRSGTFALQAHDPNSTVWFRKIDVQRLPDQAPAVELPSVDDAWRDILKLSTNNVPVVDYHVHLKGISLPDAMALSRKHGIGYGIAVNGGVGFPVTNDQGLLAFLDQMKGQPVFKALQGEGREWQTLFSKDVIRRFDYVFSDALTFTHDDGRRMRIWIPAEVGAIPDPQAFMEMYVNRIVGVIEKEPIDIFVNPTFLPEPIAAQYETLWTDARMRRVIDAAVKSGVAIEINNRYQIPNARFVKLAKQAGAKFACGTNNADANLGRIDHCRAMIREAGLKWQDMWVPPAVPRASR